RNLRPVVPSGTSNTTKPRMLCPPAISPSGCRRRVRASQRLPLGLQTKSRVAAELNYQVGLDAEGPLEAARPLELVVVRNRLIEATDAPGRRALDELGRRSRCRTEVRIELRGLHRREGLRVGGLQQLQYETLAFRRGRVKVPKV